MIAGAELRPASIHVVGGRIARVAAWDDVPAGASIEDLGDAVIMPGLVDTHVHVNDPGRAEWEGFATATRAAAAGGVTTLVDMPLNSIPPTTTVAGLAAKSAAADGQIFVDVGFCGGVVPANAGELRGLVAAGALAFKCFLSDPGVPEFAHVGEDDLHTALPILAALGAPLFVHAELPGQLHVPVGDPRAYQTWLDARPRAAENEAVKLIVALARRHGARAHIVHLSSAEALDDLRRARDEEVAVTAETCPHYLTFAAEEIPDGRTDFKCAPPIRERQNREELWDALRQGLVTQVVTDHSPSTPALKCCDSGDFVRAWGGISSLQLGLPAVWTGARARGRSLVEVAEWMCAAPARLAGLAGKKGMIAPGYDADLCVWDPDAEMRVDPLALHHRHKITPYSGRALSGVVLATYLRGTKIDLAAAPAGRQLKA